MLSKLSVSDLCYIDCGGRREDLILTDGIERLNILEVK